MELWTSRIFTTNHTLLNIAKKYRQINFIIDHVSLYKISILWIFSHKSLLQVFREIFSQKSKPKVWHSFTWRNIFLPGAIDPSRLRYWLYISTFDFYSRTIILSLRKLISEFHIWQKIRAIREEHVKTWCSPINQIFEYFASCFLSNKFQ